VDNAPMMNFLNALLLCLLALLVFAPLSQAAAEEIQVYLGDLREPGPADPGLLEIPRHQRQSPPAMGARG